MAGRTILSFCPPRLSRFGLTLHPDKTRLLEFGRHAATNRRARGEGTPESFNFIGFTHSCATTRKGGFPVLRRTCGAGPGEAEGGQWNFGVACIRPSRDSGAHVRAVVSGHVQYDDVPMNQASVRMPRTTETPE